MPTYPQVPAFLHEYNSITMQCSRLSLNHPILIRPKLNHRERAILGLPWEFLVSWSYNRASSWGRGNVTVLGGRPRHSPATRSFDHPPPTTCLKQIRQTKAVPRLQRSSAGPSLSFLTMADVDPFDSALYVSHVRVPFSRSTVETDHF